MAEEKCCCGHCVLLWLSGLLAAPAIMHIVRLILGWPLTLAEHTFTTKETIVIAVVTGIFSIVLGIVGCIISRRREGGACS